MTPKHQPATPLPWTSQGFQLDNDYWYRGHIYGPGGRLVAEVNLTNGPFGKDGVRTFDFITHSANAYPRLVKRYKMALHYLRDEGVDVREDEALLRELGEE